MHLIGLGGMDWRLPYWEKGFYPVGMPEDWRLTYYNTQFSCVWLPHASWSRVQPAEARSWVEDTHEHFHFILESGRAKDKAEQDVLDALSPRLGLCCEIDHPDLLWFESGVDLRQLSASLARRSENEGRTFLLSRDGDQATLDKVATLIELLGLGPAGRVG